MATQLSEAISRIKDAIKGRVLTPDDAEYDEARQIWNAMIDRRPAVIVQPADAGDIWPAIEFSRAHALEISARGAAHNIAGNALCDRGMKYSMTLT
jgi:FAD/FMN-containing dehydrogenase